MLQPLATDREPPGWVDAYVGIPFEEGGYDRAGLHCWGLLRLVLGERAGIWVPRHDELRLRTDDVEGISSAILRGLPDWEAVSVRAGNGPVDLAGTRLLDGVLMRVRGRPVHVGLVVARGWMLHVERGIDSMIERFDRGPWSHRVLGVHRHGELTR